VFEILSFLPILHHLPIRDADEMVPTDPNRWRVIARVRCAIGVEGSRPAPIRRG
jgi:hypothetical protein